MTSAARSVLASARPISSRRWGHTSALRPAHGLRETPARGEATRDRGLGGGSPGQPWARWAGPRRTYPGCRPCRRPRPPSCSAAAGRPPRRSGPPGGRRPSPPRQGKARSPAWRDRGHLTLRSPRQPPGRPTAPPPRPSPHTYCVPSSEGPREQTKPNIPLPGSQPSSRRPEPGLGQTQRVAAAWEDELLGCLQSPTSNALPPHPPGGRRDGAGRMDPSTCSAPHTSPTALPGTHTNTRVLREVGEREVRGHRGRGGGGKEEATCL